MEEALTQALMQRKAGHLKESNKLLLKLLQKQKTDPFLNYQVAWSFDLLEKETEAIYYYEAAIENGLEGSDLEGAYLGLGSTYRVLGKYNSAEKVLRTGMTRFPLNNGLKVFYSMVLYNLEKYSEGMEILLTLISTTSYDETINEYKKAILHYSNQLDRVWDE